MAAGPAPTGNLPKIIAIDDDPIFLGVLSEVLHSAGFDVTPFEDGEEALFFASSLAPSLITLDIEMPRLNGFDVLRYLKEGSRTQSIPVMMLTVRKDPESVQRALRSGAADYFTKPFDRDKLIARVNKVLAGPHQRVKSTITKFEWR